MQLTLWSPNTGSQDRKHLRVNDDGAERQLIILQFRGPRFSSQYPRLATHNHLERQLQGSDISGLHKHLYHVYRLTHRHVTKNNKNKYLKGDD